MVIVAALFPLEVGAKVTVTSSLAAGATLNDVDENVYSDLLDAISVITRVAVPGLETVSTRSEV
jgi:hypothetical protein